MLFNSLQFLLFFTIVTILYFQLKHTRRWALLLFASCYFYMVFQPKYILILGFTIVIDYIAGIWIEQSKGARRKLFLVCSLVANIGVLAVFKYWNFLAENINLLAQSSELSLNVPILQFMLPIGLSFHTFQAMSYTIEVYRGNQKAERRFGIYSLYVMFYPQLVAGPIERPQNLLSQFHLNFQFDFSRFQSGLMLMLWGFFKKVVIADRLGDLVYWTYKDIPGHSGLVLLVATVFFAFQIYCDFSGYSDIAIGCARIMGVNLMQNFNAPYLSTSISEFWSRWHISLSTWFKDYLYIPLGGNRKGEVRTYFNLFFVFVISGLWHGANWTFMMWGALHGTYLIVTILLTKTFPHIRLPKLSRQIITFLLVAITWVFFRATTITDAFLVLERIFLFTDGLVGAYELYKPDTLFCYGVIVLLMVKEATNWQLPDSGGVKYWAWAILLLLLCYFFGVFSLHQFIYFQF